MFYSPKSGGFYIEGFNFDVPNDAVEISSEKYEELKHGLALGLVVLIGDDGVPVAAPAFLTEEGEAIMERAWRDSVIAQTDYLAMPDYPLTEEARSKILEYRQQLRDWPSTSYFPNKQCRPNPPTWLETD